jgi:hypothetical protein
LEARIVFDNVTDAKDAAQLVCNHMSLANLSAVLGVSVAEVEGPDGNICSSKSWWIAVAVPAFEAPSPPPPSQPPSSPPLAQIIIDNVTDAQSTAPPDDILPSVGQTGIVLLTILGASSVVLLVNWFRRWGVSLWSKLCGSAKSRNAFPPLSPLPSPPPTPPYQDEQTHASCTEALALAHARTRSGASGESSPSDRSPSARSDDVRLASYHHVTAGSGTLTSRLPPLSSKAMRYSASAGDSSPAASGRFGSGRDSMGSSRFDSFGKSGRYSKGSSRFDSFGRDGGTSGESGSGTEALSKKKEMQHKLSLASRERGGESRERTRDCGDPRGLLTSGSDLPVQCSFLTRSVPST